MRQTVLTIALVLLCGCGSDDGGGGNGNPRPGTVCSSYTDGNVYLCCDQVEPTRSCGGGVRGCAISCDGEIGVWYGRNSKVTTFCANGAVYRCRALPETSLCTLTTCDSPFSTPTPTATVSPAPL